MYCDNETAINLDVNPVFHAHPKHNETYVREKVLFQDRTAQKIKLINKLQPY